MNDDRPCISYVVSVGDVTFAFTHSTQLHADVWLSAGRSKYSAQGLVNDLRWLTRILWTLGI
jgi:hypothetical protein